MELDTGQLNSVLSRALGSAFGGTYPRDLIPHRLRPYERAMVINTDPHDQPGTHWVCMYVVPPVVEYFDSYGLKPFLPEILNLIDSHCCCALSSGAAAICLRTYVFRSPDSKTLPSACELELEANALTLWVTVAEETD